MIRLTLAFVLALIWGPALAETAPKIVPQNPSEVRLSFAPVVKRVLPAVVNVYASRVETMPRNSLFDDPIFRQFFGGDSDSRISKSLGSGVIVDPSGLVVTNYHVIESMTDVKVALSDRREFEAQIVLRDPRTDLAVLRLAGADNFPVLELGDSDALEVGDFVIAIGNPFGVGQTVTKASFRRLRARRSGSATTASSSRPTPPSIPAIRAARWSISAASSSASIRRSTRARAAAWGSASPFPSTW